MIRKILLLFFAMIFLSSCSAGYLIKQGFKQLTLYSQRIPITDALKDPEVPEEVKAKLRYAQEVKKFAVKNLGLKLTKSYDSYLPYKKPYLTWVVSAADRFSMKQHLFKYPFIGALPYKGFFEFEDAEKEAQYLEQKGFDTYIRGVTAYSTLGYMADPLTTPQLLRMSDASLAELLIHELTHATIYLPGEGDFNETLAEFVGVEGCRVFLDSQFGRGSKQIREWETSRKDSRVWEKFIQDSVEELKAFYEKNKGDPNLPELKAKNFESLKKKFLNQYLP